MFRYIITFSKTGTICYTSHLDMMKLFQRVFKRAGIRQSYSQGFNPHPKMGFAQPLSLGYWGMKELLEFETEEAYEPAYLEKTLKALMPEGLEILSCQQVPLSKKTLAAQTEAAEYIIAIPLQTPLSMDGAALRQSYMGQDRIPCMKKQKKKKELAEVDIKPMIREITFTPEQETLFVAALLDSGSTSNLSPELLIETIGKRFQLDTPRSEIQVMRKEILFQK